MTQPNVTEIPLPDLNREKVVNRAVGIPFFDQDAYGTFKLALKHFRFEPGQKKNPYFRADCKILESNNEAWPVGREASVYFATGRPGTTTDPGRPERDDAYVASFVRAVFKVSRGKPYDNNKGMKLLLEKGKLPDDSIQFTFIRRAGNTIKMIDRKTQQVNDVTFPKDSFEICVTA
jgi:hypothetical protein